MFEKKEIAYFLTIIATVGLYAAWNLAERRKIAKRIKRHGEFLEALENYRNKYAGSRAIVSEEAKAELFKLMTAYEI